MSHNSCQNCLLLKLLSKKKSFLNFLLPFALLFQWTLPSIEMKRDIPKNFGELVLEKCNDPEHSHPPLSKRETSEDPEKFVISDLIHLHFIDKQNKIFKISFKKRFNKASTVSELSFSYFPPSRAPPYFEV